MYRIIVWIFILGLAATASLPSQAAEQLYTNQASVTPELADPGKYSVGVSTIASVNPAQLSSQNFSSSEDRTLSFEVWYPAKLDSQASPASYSNVTRSHREFTVQGTAYRDAEPLQEDNAFPLVVLSHGYTGYRTIMFYLGEHLASHGYVVVGIDHTDSTNAEVDFSTSAGSGFISTLRNRARDQQFVLDYFTQQNTPLANSINTELAAIIGYSMGGFGAINTIGGCYSFTATGLLAMGAPKEQSKSLANVLSSCNAGRRSADPRWKAMIAFAPWGGEQAVHTTESLKSIKVPSLYVSGSLDDISGYQNGVKSLFEQSQSASTYLMVYENARHNIAAHPAPSIAFDNDLDIGHYYEPSWSTETLNRINRHMSLAFLNCFVKNAKAFCDYLPTRTNITQTKTNDGAMTPAWPGFNNRWGTGVKFYRKKHN